jgi:hypothetical protein
MTLIFGNEIIKLKHQMPINNGKFITLKFETYSEMYKINAELIKTYNGKAVWA